MGELDASEERPGAGDADAVDASGVADALAELLNGLLKGLLDAVAASVAFTFGFVVSSAKSAGTIMKANTVVEINRATRFIVAP